MGLDNPIHILIILVVLLMLFGAKRLPELGRGMGSGLRGFKDGLTSSEPDEKPAVTETAAPQPTVTPVQQAAAPAEPPTPAERQTPV